MNVLVLIEGREAIPVRAIPLLTNWDVLSPDVVAEVLAGDSDFFHVFKGLIAHRVEHGVLKEIRPAFWENYIVPSIAVLSDRIKDKQVTYADGYSQWQSESLKALPAGAFVWRDEFEPRFWAKYGPEGETVLRITADERFEPVTRNEDIEPDFDPFIPSTDVARLVMEGFESPDFVSKVAPSEHGLVVPDAEHEAPPTGAQKLTQDVEPEKAVSQGTDGAELPLTKFALIKLHKNRWPTIERDIKEASVNGLATFARPQLGRGWIESKALVWARSKGKLTDEQEPQNGLAAAMHSMSSLPSRQHRLK